MRRVLALLTLAAALVVLVQAPAGAGTPHLFEHHPPLHLLESGLLRRAGGRLWWVTRDCTATAFDMVRQDVSVAPGRYCQIWPSPGGNLALATDSTGPPPGPPGRLAVLSGRTLHQIALTPLRGDQVVPPVLWSQTGLALACITEHGGRTTIELLEKPWSTAVALANRCTPALTAAQTLLASAGDAVYENGQNLGISSVLDRGAHGRPVAVTALAATRQGLAVAVSREGDNEVILIDRSSGAVHRIHVPGVVVTQIGVSPDGTQLWYKIGAKGDEVLVDLGDQVQPGGVPAAAAAYAWSPDGRYIAAAANGSIRVFDRANGTVATIDAGPVTSLSWTS